MLLEGDTIIPFVFEDIKKLIAIYTTSYNLIEFNDVKTAVYKAFNLKKNCEFYNPKIGFKIPEDLFIPYLEQRHDLTNFVIKIVETDEIKDDDSTQENSLITPHTSVEGKISNKSDGHDIPLIKPQTSVESNISNKRDGTDIPLAQIKEIKFVFIDQQLEEILKNSVKGQVICKNFESSNELGKEDRLALIELVISFEFKNLLKSKEPTAITTKRVVYLTNAIVGRFPGEDHSEYFVEYSKSLKYIAGGKLYDHFIEKKIQYIKQMERGSRYLCSSDDGFTEHDFPEVLELQQITGDWNLFFRVWQYTLDLRMAFCKNSCQPMDYFEVLVSKLNDRIIDLVEYDFDRLHPKKCNNLFTHWDQLSERVFTEAHLRGLKNVDLITDPYGVTSEISGLMMLSYFVENYQRDARPFKKDDSNNLVIHIVESINGDPEEFFREYYAYCTERLVVFATGKTTHEIVFYVLLGSKLLRMENALKAVDLVFKCFQVLHIFYPDEQLLSWEAIQNVIYNTDPEKSYDNTILSDEVSMFLKNL